MVANQKRHLPSKYNSFASHKELFDWEANELTQAKERLNGSNAPSKASLTKTLKNQTNHNIFSDTPLYEKKLQKVSTHNNLHTGTGDIFTWKGINTNQQEKKIEVKRRNPNETVNVVKPEKKIKKLNTMLESSNDNFLKRK